MHLPRKYPVEMQEKAKVGRLFFSKINVTELPATFNAFCRSSLTSVSVCTESHMLHRYLLGITLIIHAASHLLVTGYDSLLTVFPAAVHVSVSFLCAPSSCANMCATREQFSFVP